MRGWKDSVLVFDFDKAEIVKRCQWPPTHDPASAVWLTNQPQLGLSFDWRSGGGNPVRGMLLDPAKSCAEGMHTPRVEDIRNIADDGAAGVADTFGRYELNFGIDPKDPANGVTAFLGRLVPLGYAVPPSLWEDRKAFTRVHMEVNNEHLFVIKLYERTPRDLYFRKRDNTWHMLTVPGSRLPSVRSFGKYLVATEIWVKDSLHTANAGEKNWRQTDLKYAADDDPPAPGLGPLLQATLSNYALLGRIHIVDIDSGQQFTIDAKQADSEVLLIENDLVYYRVADHLYSAKITANGIETAQPMATDDAIRDAHWAFIKH